MWPFSKWHNEGRVIWFWNTRIRGYKFHFLHGFCAWELQAGQHVFQWFYRDTVQRANLGKAFRHWLDEYGLPAGA